jgi:5-aminolevulinate synthase
MNYQNYFKGALDNLRSDGNYRVFAELERHCGAFPRATSRGVKDGEVTIWCSNDYLGMGQHADVLAAMHEARDRCGACCSPAARC